jgi:hypothetical protein
MTIPRSVGEYPSSGRKVGGYATRFQNTMNRWSHRQDATSGLALAVDNLNHPSFTSVLVQQNMLPLQ